MSNPRPEQRQALPAWRRDEDRRETASEMLERVLELQPGPLIEPRPPDRRLMGCCYHSAVLLCALLRSRSIPSRARCGFASYLARGLWTDHWIVEVWDGAQWRATDPDTGIALGPGAVFQSGAAAWLRCRDDPATASSYGNGQLFGWGELRGSAVCDFAALNKDERLFWDQWPLAALPPEFDLAEDVVVDQLARASTGAVPHSVLVQTYLDNPHFAL